ncbi:hypothetical protein D9M68_905150 [compost metagenome]
MSQRASSILSGTIVQNRKPRKTAGRPSHRNIHCQPLIGRKSGDAVISQADSGLPITPDMGSAVMNVAMTLPRVRAGNHWLT